MTRRAESPGPAREHDQPLFGAVRAPDAGEPAARVAAIEVTLDDLLDDRSEKTVLLLKAALILGQETVETMKKHPLECRPLRMPGTIHQPWRENALKKRAIVMGPAVPAGEMGEALAPSG